MTDDERTHPNGTGLLGAKVSRRRLVQGAAAGGAAAALTGAAWVAPRVYVKAATEVTFWTGFTDPDLSILKKMVDTFNSNTTDFQVKLVQIPPAEVTDVSKLMTAVRGGTGPDVYHLDRFIVAQRAADGLLEDITSMASSIIGNYLPFARAEATFNAKTYALPFDTDTRALYYNPKMIQDAGFDPKEFDPANGPLTWDRVKEVAFKIDKKDASGNFTQVGFVPWFNQGWHYTYGFSWGGSFFDQAKCQVTPDEPKVVQAFQWVYDYCKADGAQQLNAFAGPQMKPGAPPQENPFTIGKLAMQITGDWHINQMKQYAPNTDYGITYIPIPAKGDQPSTWAGGWSVVIPKGAKYPEQAFKFMQYFAGEEGQRTYTKESQHLPTWQSLLEDATLFEGKHAFFAQKLLPIAKNRPPLPVGALYWDQLTTAWQQTYLNQKQPADALKAVKDTVQAQLDQYCPLK